MVGRSSGWCRGGMESIVVVGVVGVEREGRSSASRLQGSTGALAVECFNGVGGVRGESVGFGSEEGCGIVVGVGIGDVDVIGFGVVVLADISAIQRSISAIFFWTCWCNASRSKGLQLNVIAGREVVRGVIDSGMDSGGVVVAADRCCTWGGLSWG